jgi:hypothetical protein
MKLEETSEDPETVQTGVFPDAHVPPIVLHVFEFRAGVGFAASPAPGATRMIMEDATNEATSVRA